MKVTNLSPKQEFIELMTSNFKTNGLSELTSKITGILYSEPGEVSLEEIAKRTGYCLSAISTEIKLLEGMGIVRRMKKSGSRKVYLFMDKDIMSKSLELMQKKYESVILKSKNVLPEIIKRYKEQAKTKAQKQELKIVLEYYHQIVHAESIIPRMIEILKEKR